MDFSEPIGEALFEALSASNEVLGSATSASDGTFTISIEDNRTIADDYFLRASSDALGDLELRAVVRGGREESNVTILSTLVEGVATSLSENNDYAGAIAAKDRLVSLGVIRLYFASARSDTAQ